MINRRKSVIRSTEGQSLKCYRRIIRKNLKNRFGLLDSDIETIIQTLKMHPKVEIAYIFGSRVKGNFKNGSDVDIALKGTGLDFDIQSQISYWLNEETNMPYKFDVLIYEYIREPKLQEHIDRVGVEIYNKKALKKIILKKFNILKYFLNFIG